MDISNIAQQQLQSHMAGAAQQAVTAQGTLGGARVSVSNPFSLVANSAEEASFAMSEREEVRLEERKMMPRIISKERVEQVEKYLELMDKQEKSKKIDAFISELAGSGLKAPDQAVTLAQKYFEDPAEAFAALSAARQELSAKFDPDFFDEALAQLDDASGREIRSSMASGAAALAFDGLAAPDTLKAVYADLSGEAVTPSDTFEKLLETYGESRMEEALGFLSRSLGNEIAATNSRTDKVLLESLLGDMGAVRQLNGLHMGCRTFEGRLETAFGRAAMPAGQMMKEVLALGRAGLLGAFDIENIADRCGLDQIEDRISFFREFTEMARGLSENLFPDPNARLNIIDAAEQALKDAGAIEEEMYK